MTGTVHIAVAMKPVDGSFAENALECGVAGLWIDGGRVGTGGDKTTGGCAGTSALHGGGITDRTKEDQTVGRWPANMILSHSPKCIMKGVKKVTPKEGYRSNPVGKQADGKIQFSVKPGGYQKTSYTDKDGMEARCRIGTACLRVRCDYWTGKVSFSRAASPECVGSRTRRMPWLAGSL